MTVVEVISMVEDAIESTHCDLALWEEIVLRAFRRNEIKTNERKEKRERNEKKKGVGLSAID